MSGGLRVENVSWQAGGRTVLADVTLALSPGDIVGLLGRNGAGKSTLLDVMAGVRAPSTGRVVIEGRPARELDPRARARAVAHLPQSVPADVPFLARELVLMGRYPHTDRWFESDADRVAVEDAMRRTDCWTLRDRPVRTLSGGERQRVLIASCLAQRPKMLLLDEPATHLDVDQQLHCFAILREESQRGVASIAVTHDVNLALAFATRIVVMAEGRLAADVCADEARRDPTWLSLFSSRLSMTTTAAGQSWAAYT